ncbi:hypothetical protein [Mitsuaria sp. 7]|uniref:hypothetical protein n=1 Tax=Mitsuaria sp. 7 TaxID=1658665 RepID=UPI0018D42FB7|nr:hypothetical protein [Mitsuaria sp. 7]
MQPDMSKVFEWNTYFERSGSRDDDAVRIAALHQEAKGFLTSFKWCVAVEEEYVGFIFPGIVGVFLFKIQGISEAIDEWVWIVVGDLPPAYITCEESPNPATALDSYMGAMREWIEAIDRGDSVDGLIPVNAPATRETAKQLAARLKFIDENILSGYDEDLKA